VSEQSLAFGDLNGDGITDFAASIDDPKYNHRGVKNHRIVVFFGAAGDAFEYYGSSLDVIGHERVDQTLEINKGTLRLHRDGSGGCCSRWMEEFKFKMLNHHLLLVGFETAQYAAGDTPDDNGTSMNLLTGDVIEWGVHGKNRYEKKKPKVTTTPVTLETFDYEQFTKSLLLKTTNRAFRAVHFGAQ
jgi:hypothetical protein